VNNWSAGCQDPEENMVQRDASDFTHGSAVFAVESAFQLVARLASGPARRKIQGISLEVEFLWLIERQNIASSRYVTASSFFIELQGFAHYGQKAGTGTEDFGCLEVAMIPQLSC